MIFLLSFSGLYASDVDHLDSADLQTPASNEVIVPDDSSSADAINTVDDDYQDHNNYLNPGYSNAENSQDGMTHLESSKKSNSNIKVTTKTCPRDDTYYATDPLDGQTIAEFDNFKAGEVLTTNLDLKFNVVKSNVLIQEFKPTVSNDYQTIVADVNLISSGLDEHGGSVSLTNYMDDLSNDVVMVEFDNLNPIHYESEDSKQIPTTNLYADTTSIGTTYLGNKAYAKSNAKQIIILNPKDIFIESNDLTLKYGYDDYFEAVLTDNEDNIIQDQTVLFSIGQKTYAAKTDKDGIARIQINLKPGKYTIYTSFKGTDFYNEANAVNTITITGSSESRLGSGVVRSISESTIQDNTNSQKTDTKDTSIDSSVKTFSLNQIITASKSLRTYYAISGQFPETVKVGSVDVSLNEFLYYESMAILNIENDYRFAIKRINFNDEALKTGITSIDNEKLYKIRYIDTAKDVSNFILENNCGMDNIITSVGTLTNTQLIDAFAGILDYYSKNNVLPDFVTINGENPASLPIAEENSPSLDETEIEGDIQISASNVVMQSGENKYFEVKLNDGCGNPLSNEKISLTLKRFKLEYNLQKDDWAYEYANTNQFTVKTNKDGIALLKLNLKTGHYKVNASFNKDGIFKTCSNDINVNTNPQNFDGDSTQKIFSI